MSTATAPPQGKRALLVGIDTYPKLGKEFQLRGAMRDAERFGDLLCRNFGFPAANVTLLRNEEAVRDQVLSAMRRLVDETRPDDVVVFYFSGHGSQRTDLENDEDDGYDETILPYDSGRGSTVANRDITDDEIYLWLRALGVTTSNITLVFDCCNSGNMSRAAFEGTNRMAPRDDRPASELPPSPIPREEWTALARANQKKASAGWLPIGEKYVMIAACRGDQKAGEYPPGAADGAEVHGCLTYFLLQELATAGPGTTYRDVFEPTRRRVTAVYPEQVPQLEGNRDRILFGATDLEPMRYLSITERSAQTMTLDGGRAYAVRTGSRWVVYPAGTKKPEPPAQPLGEVEIRETRGLSSTAIIASEVTPGAVVIGGRAFPLDPGIGMEPMAVRLAQSPDGSLGPYRALDGELSRSPQLRLARDGGAAPYEVVLLGPRGNPGPHDRVPDAGPVTAPAWAIVATGDRPVAPLQPAVSVGAVRTDLETIARYHEHLNLRNPASPLAGKFDIALFRSREGGTWEPARPEADGKIPFLIGDRLAFRVINGWQNDLYLNVLEFDYTYRVWLAYPPARGAHEMARRIPPLDYGRLPSQVLKFLPMPAWFARAEGYETLKFILADGPIDYSWMQQEGVGRRARGLEEWSTLEIDLVIRRSCPVVRPPGSPSFPNVKAPLMSTEATAYPLCLNTPTGGPAQYDMPPRVAEDHEPGKKAAIADVLWPDRVVQVGFVNPPSEWGNIMRQQVRAIAPIWSQHANVEFQFTDGWTEDITINFEPDAAQKWGYGTYFSYLGTDARNYSRSSKPSMCLIFDLNDPLNNEAEFRRVILHEFGHALGLIHEHMRPDRPILWNLEAVWQQYSRTGWDWNMIVAQIVRVYGSNSREKPIIDQTPFDPQSIMMYPFPPGLAYSQDGTPFVSGWNRELTQNDIDLISRTYPKDA